MQAFEAAKKKFRAQEWHGKVRFWRQPQRRWLVHHDGRISAYWYIHQEYVLHVEEQSVRSANYCDPKYATMTSTVSYTIQVSQTKHKGL
jgi:hypothetical protein